VNPDWIEGKLAFDFSGATGGVARRESEANPLSCVDFCAEYSTALWLVEVKDPEGTPEPHAASAVKGALKELLNDQLLRSHLLPKLYGTFAHLVLLGREPRGSVRYAILIGLSSLTAADRTMLRDKVQRVVDRIGPKIRYARHWPVVEVHTLDSWNATYSWMTVTRLP